MRTWLSGLACLALTACSSIDRDIAFDANASGGFALVAAGGMILTGSHSYTFVFRRVDIETGVFLDDRIRVHFDTMGAIAGDEFQKPDDLRTGLRFGGRPAPVGDYALVARNDYTSFGTFSSTTINCFSSGAPVFRVRPGAISVINVPNVRTGDVPGQWMVLRQVREVLAAYPNMGASPIMASGEGSIVFETMEAWSGAETCAPIGTFRFIPAPPPDPSSEIRP